MSVILDGTSKSLQFVLSGAVAANQLSCVASWADITGSTFTPGSTESNSNNTTAVTIVGSPASGTQRQVKTVDVYNADTASAGVTVSYNNGTSLFTLVDITLQSGETLQFAESAWSVINSSGAVVQAYQSAPAGSAGGDLSGSYPNPTVAKVNGITLPATAPTTNQVLTATSSSTTAWQTPTAGSSTLASDTDVAISSPANNQVLTYNTTSGKWVNQTPTSGSSTLAADTDVSITSPTNNQVLTYNSASSKWVNQSSSSLSLDTTATDIQALGVQSAGSSGLAADAKHVHPMPTLDQLGNPAANVSMNAFKLTNVANGTLASDVAAFGQIPTSASSIGGLLAASNLSDVASASTARTNLGLGTAATENVGTTAGTVMAGNQAAGGDLSGTLPNPTVAKVNGVAVSGTPIAGQVITATSGTAASWSGISMTASGLATTTNQQGGEPLVLNASGSMTWGYPWQFNVVGYGAKGDGATDDTAAIQAAINAAFSYAQSSGSNYAQVYFPIPPAGSFYKVSGALVTGGSTKGNAVLTIPINATTSAKVILHFKGDARGVSTTNYFGSSTVAYNGVILKTTTTQNTLDTTNGEASVLGGPTPQQGYGKSTHVFNNIHVIVEGVGVMVTHTHPGTICGIDLRGCASAHIIDSGCFVDQYPASMSVPPNTGYDFGLGMPFPGNNDHCDVDQWTAYGMTYGMMLSEHVSLKSARVLYCNVGVAAIGSYEGSGGALLNGAWQYISCEAFNVGLLIVSASRVNIMAMDFENPTGTSPLHIKDAPGTAIGYVGISGDFTGTYTTPLVSSTSKLDWKWINRVPGAITAPTLPASTTTYLNQLGRPAAVVLTGGTISAVTVDGASTGYTSTPCTVIVPNQRTIAVTYSAAPTWTWTLI